MRAAKIPSPCKAPVSARTEIGPTLQYFTDSCFIRMATPVRPVYDQNSGCPQPPFSRTPDPQRLTRRLPCSKSCRWTISLPGRDALPQVPRKPALSGRLGLQRVRPPTQVQELWPLPKGIREFSVALCEVATWNCRRSNATVVRFLDARSLPHRAGERCCGSLAGARQLHGSTRSGRQCP